MEMAVAAVLEEERAEAGMETAARSGPWARGADDRRRWR